MPHALMHCHHPSCVDFNVEQKVRYLDACWEYPSEWVDEPECRSCLSELHDSPLDVQDLIDSAAERFNDDWADWTPRDTIFFTAAQQYLSEGRDA